VEEERDSEREREREGGREGGGKGRGGDKSLHGEGRHVVRWTFAFLYWLRLHAIDAAAAASPSPRLGGFSRNRKSTPNVPAGRASCPNKKLCYALRYAPRRWPRRA
jgi:hypothetical protein